MYCVYCGVKLQDGAPECPLCHTKVQAVPLPEQDPPAGNGKKVERGMGNNHSPFLSMDETQGK